MKFVVEKTGDTFKVKDTSTGGYITKDCPEDVANEIASDFNAMENKDYTPIGGPNISSSNSQ